MEMQQIRAFVAAARTGVFRIRQRRHPSARLIVRTQSLDETVEMLRTGDLDLGWRGVSSTPPGILFKPRATFDRVLISARTHPIAGARTITKLAWPSTGS